MASGKASKKDLKGTKDRSLQLEYKDADPVEEVTKMFRLTIAEVWVCHALSLTVDYQDVEYSELQDATFGGNNPLFGRQISGNTHKAPTRAVLTTMYSTRAAVDTFIDSLDQEYARDDDGVPPPPPPAIAEETSTETTEHTDTSSADPAAASTPTAQTTSAAPDATTQAAAALAVAAAIALANASTESPSLPSATAPLASSATGADSSEDEPGLSGRLVLPK